ncbi:hypothetical protein Avbf_00874 [Armadillidium vulgare]|nr:hypothetical protein Avbf_00874 [Armadillidium vulgare]
MITLLNLIIKKRREIVGESNKDLLKKLFEKLLEEEIIQRLNSLRRQQKAYCLNHYLRLYIHPIIPSLTNITNTLLMEGRKDVVLPVMDSPSCSFIVENNSEGSPITIRQTPNTEETNK